MTLQDKIDKFLEKFSRDVEQDLKEELSWTTNLKNNIKVVPDEDSISLVMPDYGVFVEYGRGPGKQPPLNVIQEWVISKKIPLSAAYPIAKKIGEEGLPPHPFLFVFENSLDDLADGIAEIISDNIVDGIGKLI